MRVWARVGAWLRRLFGGRAGPTDPFARLEPERTRLIVGLGNPGPEYADTRHNVGFRTVDELAARAGARWLDRHAQLEALVAVAGDTLLLKPQTYMNRSGEAVAAALAALGLRAENALIVFDDMDLPFGTLRLRERGSPGTHNGMRSVVSAVATEAIPRLRIGISQSGRGGATNHVLGEFTSAEREAVTALVARAADAAVAWAIDGAASAMNRYNKT